MLSDNRVYGLYGRPAVNLQNSHDLDIAQHFLADHATALIVAFDHDATDPQPLIYVETPSGALSAGDYYLWPLLHETAKRIEAELDELRRNDQGRWRWDYYRSSLRKWAKRLTHLQTLIRIRKSTVHALRVWDLQDMRPGDLVVIDTDRNLTGLTRQAALELIDAP